MGYGTKLTTNPSLPSGHAAPQASLGIFLRLQGRDAHFQCGQTVFDIMQLRLCRLLAGPGIGGQLRHRIEFLTLHQIQTSDRLIDARPCKGLDLLAEACKGGDRAAGHTGEVVEKTRSVAHSCQPLSADSPRPV